LEIRHISPVAPPREMPLAWLPAGRTELLLRAFIMGTAHVLMQPSLIAKLLLAHANDVVLAEMKLFGDHEYQVAVQSHKLADGYHGQMAVVVDERGVRFKKDEDV
jgi:hypothetical protein